MHLGAVEEFIHDVIILQRPMCYEQNDPMIFGLEAINVRMHEILHKLFLNICK